ncbi:hypothetical protein [Streptomyces sp. NPDC057363]|uniref:hypothetical protein n=1 Tax=Streptomyces sp. NPDC057363 TaxID=3346107 RepID=UPI00362C9F4A
MKGAFDVKTLRAMFRGKGAYEQMAIEFLDREAVVFGRVIGMGSRIGANVDGGLVEDIHPNRVIRAYIY